MTGASTSVRRQKFLTNEPARKDRFVERIQQIDPTGKAPQNPSSPAGKNILIFRN
jgi:hypothetical protein